MAVTGMTLVRKEHLKSLILSEDKDFWSQATKCLHAAGFQAEKIYATNLAEFKSSAMAIAGVGNLVVDCSGAPGLAAIQDILEGLKKPSSCPTMAMLFYGEGEEYKVKKLVPQDPRIHLVAKPLSQRDFIRVFHNLRDSAQPEVKTANKGGGAALGLPQKQQTVRKENQANEGFNESLQYLKDTIESISSLQKDRKNMKALDVIAQRFNGLLGTYSHFAEKEGFREIADLAKMIESVCMTYEKDPSKLEVSASHAQFILNAAKCCFQYFGELKKGEKEFSDAVVGMYTKAKRLYESFEGLTKRESMDQDEVDSLLDSLDKTS